MPQSLAIIGIKDTSKTNPILWDNQKNDGLKGQKCGQIKKSANSKIAVNAFNCWWSHLGSNQGPTDYESATLTN
jgi:hypothetical protein